MQIKNAHKNTVLASSIIEAKSFSSRLKGLLGRAGLKAGEALVLNNCRAVHMMGMRFAIDVVFVDKTLRIVRIVPSLKPWSLSPIDLKAKSVIELPTGTIKKSRSEVGDQLVFI